MTLKKKALKNTVGTSIFSSSEHKVLRVSYCDHSLSVGCPFVVSSHFLVYTLASTNINQSAPNLVKIFMTIRSRMSLILDIIGRERPELFAFELKKIAVFDFVYSLSIYNL